MTKCLVYYVRANNYKKTCFHNATFFIHKFLTCDLHQSKEHKNLYQNIQIKYFKSW